MTFEGIIKRHDFCSDEGHKDRGPHMALCSDGDWLKIEDVREPFTEYIDWFEKRNDAVDIYEHELKPTDMCLSAVDNPEVIIKSAREKALRVSDERKVVLRVLKDLRARIGL